MAPRRARARVLEVLHSSCFDETDSIASHRHPVLAKRPELEWENVALGSRELEASDCGFAPNVRKILLVEEDVDEGKIPAVFSRVFCTLVEYFDHVTLGRPQQIVV